MQATLPFAELLNERTPRHPYCTDDLQSGLKIRARSHALRFSHVQVNPPSLRFWMVFDVDRPGAGIAWEQAGLPAPNWAAVNRENAHAHLSWGLFAPVLTGDGRREAPLRYLCAIESAYAEKLQADTGYSGLITKNPLHPLWRVFNGPLKLYELAELADYVELDKHLPKRGQQVQEIGLGRNCVLFDWLRVWAYKAVRRHRELRNFAAWQAETYDKALQRNADFKTPLDGKEVWHIALSVAKFCWKHDPQAAAKFSERQSRRGRKGGVTSGLRRAAANEDKRASARMMKQAGYSVRVIAEALAVGKSTVGDWVSGEA